MEVEESLSELDSDMKQFIGSKINLALKEKKGNSSKFLIYELNNAKELKPDDLVERQVQLSELEYLPWFGYLLKRGAHNTTFGCVPEPQLPMVTVKRMSNAVVFDLENYEKIKQKYDKDNKLELKERSIIDSAENAIIDYNRSLNKIYGYWSQGPQIFMNFGKEWPND